MSSLTQGYVLSPWKVVQSATLENVLLKWNEQPPEIREMILRWYRQWHGTVPPCGISHVDIYNPCLPEEENGRLRCLTCGLRQRLELKSGS